MIPTGPPQKAAHRGTTGRLSAEQLLRLLLPARGPVIFARQPALSFSAVLFGAATIKEGVHS